MTDSNIYICRAKSSEWEEAMELCWRTFLEFEAKDYSDEGVKNFLNFISSSQLNMMFKEGMYKLLVAKRRSDDKIIGVASLRNKRHISLLFVDKTYHKQGIGKALLGKLQDESDNICLTVNAAPYAVGFYHKIGFMDTDKEQLADGIRFTPMTIVSRIK